MNKIGDAIDGEEDATPVSRKWTPGPWAVTDNRDLNGAYWIETDLFESLAEVRPGSTEAEEMGDTLANAHLIAAAPDLYAALETLRSYAEGQIADGLPHSPTLPSAIGMAKAALNKARGEQ